MWNVDAYVIVYLIQWLTGLVKVVSIGSRQLIFKAYRKLLDNSQLWIKIMYRVVGRAAAMLALTVRAHSQSGLVSGSS